MHVLLLGCFTSAYPTLFYQLLFLRDTMPTYDEGQSVKWQNSMFFFFFPSIPNAKPTLAELYSISIMDIMQP